MSDIVKVASIQMDCQSGKVKENLDKAESMLKKARERGAILSVLPELFNVGYQLDIIKDLEYSFNETTNQISKISKELGMYIAAGVLEKCGNNYYNSVLVYNNHGKLIEVYRKINLFSLSNEKDVFLPGNEIKMFQINDFKFGVLICYDLRFPELSRKYLEEGCSALLISSAFPSPRLEHWNILLKARAIENQVYVIASNRVGMDGSLRFVGNSCIIDPWGEVLMKRNEEEEDVLVYGICKNEVDKVRSLIPCSKDKLWMDSVLK